MRKLFLRALRLFLFAVVPLYAAHPLFLTPIARSLAERYWPGEARVGWISVTPLGRVHLSRLDLRYPSEEGWKPFVAARGIDLAMGLDRSAGGLPRIVARSLSCDTLDLVLTREGIRFASQPRPGRKGPGGGAPPQTVRLACRRGSIAIDPPDGVAIADARAKGFFLFSPDERRATLDLTVFHPRWNQGRVACEADLDAHGAVWRLDAPWVRIDAGILPFVPAPVRTRLAQLEPTGTAQFSCRILNRRGHRPVSEGRVLFDGASLRLPAPCPLPLERPRGEYVWGPSGHEVRGFRASFEGIDLAGEGRLDHEAGKFNLSVSSAPGALPQGLRGCLPPRLVATWDFLGPAGALALDVGVSGRLEPGKPVQASTSFHAELAETDLAGLKPPVHEMVGTLDLELIGAGDTLRGEGKAQLSRARVGPFLFDSLSVPIFLGTQDGARTVDLGIEGMPFEAGCAGGISRGAIHFEEKASPDAAIRVAGHDIQVERVARESFGTARPVSGRLEYEIRVSRTADGWGGSGSFDIRDGDLGRLPTLTGVIERLLGKEKVDDSRIRRVECAFIVHPNKVTLKHLKIHGKNVALYAAEGEVRYGGGIDITLYVGVRQHLLQNVPILREVWQLVTSVFTGLASVRVTGTWREPEYDIAPLRAPVKSVVKILEGLTGE